MQDLLKVPRLMAELERHVPVNDITYRGLRVWPYLRVMLSGDLFWERKGEISEIPEETPETNLSTENEQVLFEPLYGQITNLFRTQLGNQARLKPDVLFLSRGYEYATVDGKQFNKHFDPLKDVLEELGLSHLDLFASYDQEEHEPKHRPTISIGTLISLGEKIAAIKRNAAPRPAIQNLHKLASYLQEKKISVPLNYAELQCRLDYLLEYRHLFERILRMISPKVVMCVSFYNDVLFALAAACNRRGIPLVDVQHGFIQREELVMGSWTQVPKEGYELFPNYYWAWGDESCPAFESWARKSEHNLVPITGGNLWMARNLKALPKPAPKESGIERVLLFTLQQTPFKEACDLIPQAIREAIEKSPSSWRWVFRLHYKMGEDAYSLVQNYAARWENKVRMERAMEKALYTSMKEADYHLSQTSTTIVEAETLQLPNILVGPDAKIFYSEEIARGIYFHVTQGDDLIRIIEQKQQPVPRKKPIMELDSNVAKKAFQHLLAQAASPSTFNRAAQAA